MAILLYYPHIVPPAEVIHQALLYWDGVASIVPNNPDDAVDPVPPELIWLEEQGLYFWRTPQWDRFGLPREHERLSHLRERLNDELDRLPTVEPVRGWTGYFLYRNKAAPWIAYLLEQRGLAVGIRGGEVLAVTPEAHRLVMSFAVLSLTEGNMWPSGQAQVLVPCTDDENAHWWAHEDAPQFRSLAWEMELGRLLPLPAPGTELPAVVAFRDQYRDERIRLMRALHRLLGDLRRDYAHPADVFSELRREIQDAEDDFRAAAKSSRIVWVNRSLQVLVALGAAAAGALAVPDAGWLLGSVNGIALSLATRETRAIRRAPKEHDFSYLCRIRTTFPTSVGLNGQ